MTLAQGDQIGTYTIERTLGTGGMGVVYVGFDSELGRRVAIKQLLPALSTDKEIVERFFNEAKAAARINHPSIIEIYKVGYHVDGSAYFAMQLLEGESIARRMRAARTLPVEIAATIARQITSALGAAHARGIVHRDLKPDNVILVRDEEVVIGERAVVLDFGIAKLFDDGVASAKTRTGVFMGTPAYMSPEQCRGAGDVDHRTDVYALGCILFEMLTGRPPFIAQGGGEIVGMHQFVEPPPVRSLRGDVPPELDALVMRSLAKKPEDRVPSMADFAIALRPFAVQGIGTSAPWGATQVSVPAAALASTYASGSGQVSQPAPRSGIAGVLMIVFGVIALIACTALGIVTCGNKRSNDEIPVEAASGSDRSEHFKNLAKSAFAKRKWIDARVATMQWKHLDPNTDEHAKLLHKITLEQAAERALKDLKAAAAIKDHFAANTAANLIQADSTYYLEALGIIEPLRADYIERVAVPKAKELARQGKCEEKQRLLDTASKISAAAYDAVWAIPCEPK